MALTSPSDLAVAFRSFARRLREALADAEGDQSAARPHIDALVERIDAAAATLHVEPSADLAATGEAIARRIEATPADEWDVATLDALRADALAAGDYLRQVTKSLS